MADQKRTSLGKGLRRSLLWGVAALVIVIAGLLIYRQLDRKIKDYDVVITPTTIPADGVSSALLEIRIISRFGHRLNATVLPHPPEVEIVEGASLVRVSRIDSLRYRLSAGFETGAVVVHVMIWGAPAAIEARLQLTPSLADRNRNGYPDVMDLTSEGDRQSFRGWFTQIARSQMIRLDDRWHDRDCAGLLRFCYREALKRHDRAWLADRRWLAMSGIPDVRKYNYPEVPLVGTRVFNVGTRPPAQGDTTSIEPTSFAERAPQSPDADGRMSSTTLLENFAMFGEAARLKDNSLHFLSRSVADALPGDVVIYLNDTKSAWPYHTMIYLGDGSVIYHTGPDGNKPGIVKHLTLDQLAMHPNPRWHPVPGNPYFLGFYRWRILG